MIDAILLHLLDSTSHPPYSCTFKPELQTRPIPKAIASRPVPCLFGGYTNQNLVPEKLKKIHQNVSKTFTYFDFTKKMSKLSDLKNIKKIRLFTALWVLQGVPTSFR